MPACRLPPILAFTVLACGSAAAAQSPAETGDRFDLICTLAGGAPAKNAISVDLKAHRFCIGSPVCRFSGAVGPIGATPDVVQLASDDPGVKVLLNLKSLNLTYRFGDPPNQHDRTAACKASTFTPFDLKAETLTLPTARTAPDTNAGPATPPVDQPPPSIVEPH